MGFLSGIGGALVGGITGLLGGQQQAEAGQAASAKQMAFQERMYKNRYQYQMADMRSAGLNPILSYRQGAPGGPAGSTYQPPNIGAAAVAGASAGASSALQTRRVSTELDRMRAEISNIEADTALKGEQQVVATTQHQLNDILGSYNVLRREMLEPEAYSARQLMELFQRGGNASDFAAALNRMRRMLGIGGGQ